MPNIPSQNNISFATNFNNNLRSLNSARFPAKVPQTVDQHLFFTVGLALDSCPTCINGSHVSASIKNISFVMPKIFLLQAHFFNITGVFTTDFPDRPPMAFNYIGTPPQNPKTSKGTRLSRIPFNSRVQLEEQLRTHFNYFFSRPFILVDQQMSNVCKGTRICLTLSNGNFEFLIIVLSRYFNVASFVKRRCRNWIFSTMFLQEVCCLQRRRIHWKGKERRRLFMDI